MTIKLTGPEAPVVRITDEYIELFGKVFGAAVERDLRRYPDRLCISRDELWECFQYEVRTHPEKYPSPADRNREAHERAVIDIMGAFPKPVPMISPTGEMVDCWITLTHDRVMERLRARQLS